jgi:hypothetical protein
VPVRHAGGDLALSRGQLNQGLQESAGREVLFISFTRACRPGAIQLHAAILDKDYSLPPHMNDELRDLLDRTFEFKPKKVPYALAIRAPNQGIKNQPRVPHPPPSPCAMASAFC